MSAVQRAPGPLEPVFLGGSLNLLAGSSGAGKTALLAYLARLLSEKRTLLGVMPSDAPYLAYVGLDKSWQQSSSRWFRLEELPDIRHYCLADDTTFKKRRLRTKNDRTAIYRECLLKVSPDGKGFPAGALVFVDPIALFLGGNLLDYDASAVACMELREVHRELGHVCVVGTVHSGKMKSDKKQGYARLQDHILGSAALHGYSDTQLFLASPEELRTKTALLHVQPHHGAARTIPLSRGEDGRFCFAGVPEAVAMPAKTWVVDVLAAAPERTLDFAALMHEAIDRDINRKMLQRQLAAEMTAGRVERIGHGKYRAVTPS